MYAINSLQSDSWINCFLHIILTEICVLSLVSLSSQPYVHTFHWRVYLLSTSIIITSVELNMASYMIKLSALGMSWPNNEWPFHAGNMITKYKGRRSNAGDCASLIYLDSYVRVCVWVCVCIRVCVLHAIARVLVFVWVTREIRPMF